MYRGHGAQLRDRLHWMKERDKGTRFVFSYLNQKDTQEIILSIYDQGGQIHDNLEDIKCIFFQHYQYLFIDLGGGDQLKDIIDASLKDMANSKNLGTNDLPIEFYKAM